MRRLAAKAAGRKHLQRAPANCLQMPAHVLLGTPAVAEAPLRSGAITLTADRCTPAGGTCCFSAFRALAHSRFPVPASLAGRELPYTCFGGEPGVARPHAGAAKQLPGAISSLRPRAAAPVPRFPRGAGLLPAMAMQGCAQLLLGCGGTQGGAAGQGGCLSTPLAAGPAQTRIYPPWGARPAPAAPAAWSQACPRPALPAPPVPARRAP